MEESTPGEVRQVGGTGLLWVTYGKCFEITQNQILAQRKLEHAEPLDVVFPFPSPQHTPAVALCARQCAKNATRHGSSAAYVAPESPAWYHCWHKWCSYAASGQRAPFQLPHISILFNTTQSSV